MVGRRALVLYVFALLGSIFNGTSGGATECGNAETRSWHAKIFRARDFVCDGAIVHKKWILTAAHCFDDKRNVKDLGAAILGDNGGEDIFYRIFRMEFYPAHVPTKEIALLARSLDPPGDPCSENGTALTGMQGNFTSPGYDGTTLYDLDLTCTWKIEVPENHKVRFEFLAFDIEHFGNCAADWVKIFLGDVAIADHLIVHICGNYLPPDFLLESNILVVKFNSDFYQGDLGFVARYSAVPEDTQDSGCGNPRVKKEEGVISSPRYPLTTFTTKPGDSCIWEIEAPAGKKILFDFPDSGMSVALDDELRIYNGRDLERDRYHAFEMYRSPRGKKVLTAGNESAVEVKIWKSTESTSTGFYANVRFIDPNETASYPDAINLDLEEYTGYCGYQEILPAFLTPRGRIVDGNESIPNSWPWQINLRRLLKPATQIVCGGTLVSNSWIVTAGHCTGHETLYAFAGDHLWYSSDYKMQISKIKRKIAHPDLRELATWDNDIALLELQYPFTYTDFVRPACVPSLDVEFPNGTVCYATGWGLTGEGEYGTETLHEAPIPIITREKCGEIYVTEFTESMLCAGYLEGGIDACQGDSGGPLVCRQPGQLSWVLYGVTSWGWGCARANYPGVYARVNRYGEWFKNMTDEAVGPNYNNSGPIPTFEPTTTQEAPTTQPTTTPEPPCLTPVIIEGGSGEISSPEPRRNQDFLNCSWIFHASHTASVMKVKFKEFAVVDCSNWTGYSENVTVVVSDMYKNLSTTEEYCGAAKPQNVVGYSVEIYFFISEAEDEKNGTVILVEYEEVDPCGGEYISFGNTTSGVLFSPNYPKSYPKNMHCTWLMPSGGMNILFDVKVLQLAADSDGACLDSVTFRTEERIHGPYCDSSSVQFIDVVGNVTVLFESTNLAEKNGSGFLLAFEHYAPLEIFQGAECFSLYFVDEAGNFTGSKQQTKSGQETICNWTIMGTMGLPISLSITPWPNISNADCAEHHVTVAFDGIEKKVCFDTPGTQTFIGTENEIQIEFVGPFVEEKIGFDASFTFVTGSKGFIARPVLWFQIVLIFSIKLLLS